MKTSMSSVFIFVPPLAAWVWGQPVDDRFRTHACERPHTRWVVPLISGHQRPAAAGDNTPRIIRRQGQDTRAHSNWPGPRRLPPGATNKVTGTLFGAGLLSTFFAVVAGFAIHPEDLRRGATPELLDDIAVNVTALRLGDEQLAREIYRDIRDQAIRAAERWYDVAVRVRLS